VSYHVRPAEAVRRGCRHHACRHRPLVAIRRSQRFTRRISVFDHIGNGMTHGLNMIVILPGSSSTSHAPNCCSWPGAINDAIEDFEFPARLGTNKANAKTLRTELGDLIARLLPE
jgi:hypothetical protein